jgi:hypothetical protein
MKTNGDLPRKAMQNLLREAHKSGSILGWHLGIQSAKCVIGTAEDSVAVALGSRAQKLMDDQADAYASRVLKVLEES